MEVTSSIIAVAHPLKVQAKSKVVVIIRFLYVDSLICRCINGTADPEPWHNLQLRGRPRFFSRLMSLAWLLRQ